MITKAKKHTDKLNAHLIDKARGNGEISYLESPVTGGGVTVGRFQQLFLLTLSQGKKQPADLAAQVWQVLNVQGQKLVKEGKTLETDEQNLAELKERAQIFIEKSLPLLKALQIA